MQMYPDFLIIPKQLLEDDRIGLVEERLYGIIYWFSRMKLKKCIASNELLAKMTKTTEGTVKNSLNSLEKYGYIKRIFSSEKKNIRSEIIPLIFMNSNNGSPTDDPRVTHRLPVGSPTGDHISNISNKIYSSASDEAKRVGSLKEKEEEEEEEKTREVELDSEGNPKPVKFPPQRSRSWELAKLYIKHRKFSYKSDFDLRRAVYRYLKPAKILIDDGYTGKEILECMKWCAKKYNEWSLETVVKKISEYKTYENS